MTQETEDLFSSRTSFVVVFCASVFLYAVQQSNYLPQLLSSLQVFGSDDAMRLAEVRDLLAGQGWFDMAQHRALPPDGVSLHWSRYIDAPLAGLNLLFSLFTDPAMAEKLAAAVWPVSLFLVYLALVGNTTRAVFGTSAACFAMIAAGLLPMVTGSYFVVGRVDHHNVQVICMFAIAATMLVRGNPLVLGALAGLVAALSLAVGLEAIVFIAVAGTALTVRHMLFGANDTRQLFGFGMAVGIAAPLLFIGQTAPAELFQPHCDELSPPFLAVTTSAAAFGLLVLLAGRLRDTRGLRVVVALLLAGGFLVFLVPLLSTCAAGPYSDLPQEVQDSVIGRIIEALPAMQLIKSGPDMAVMLLFPLYFVAFLTLLMCYRSLKSPDGTPAIRPLAVLLLFLCLGIAASLVQVRGVVMGLTLLPVAFGVVTAFLANREWRVLRWSRPIVIMLLAFIALTPQVFSAGATAATALLTGSEPRGPRKVQAQDLACNEPAKLAQLDTLEPALIMNPLNLGPGIILHTHHSVTSVPYHRSADAMANGVLPFQGSPEDMAERVQRFAVDYVLVCEKGIYQSKESMGTRLARSDLPVWLEPVDIGGGPLLVMRVLRGPDGTLKSGAGGD